MESKCADKMAFDSKKEAETAVIVADTQRGVKLKVYKCQKCDLWHMASDYS